VWELVLGGLISAFCNSVFEHVRQAVTARKPPRPESPTMADLLLTHAARPARSGTLAERVTPGLRPAVLIAPPPIGFPGEQEVGARAAALMQRIPGLDTYGQLIAEAFDRVAKAPATGVEARQYLRTQLFGVPAILVYFVPTMNGYAANAFVSGLFPTTEGDKEFDFRFAAYDWSADPAQPVTQDTSLLSWQRFGLRGTDTAEAVELIARTVAAFAAGTLDLYWQQNRVITNLLDRLMASVSADNPPTAGALPLALVDRLEQEARALWQAGYTLDGKSYPTHVQLVVKGGKESLGIVVGLDYPAQPPRVVVLNGTVEEIAIDPASWSAARSLAEIVEALR
jgi:hypothetical protein